MKLAISTDGTQVAAHFGRCPEYTIVEIEGDKVTSRETMVNPEHQPGFLPGYLSNMGVNCIITGGMGQRAQALFAQYNIQTIIGVTGPVDQVIEDYLNNRLTPGESLCDPGQFGHKDCHH